MKRSLYGRDIEKALLKLAVPMMLQGFITTSINFIDSLMVGTLSDTAVGAIAATNRFYFIMSSAAGSIAAAAAVYISQFYGARKYREVRQSFSAGALTSVSITAVFFLAVSLIPEKIIGFYNADRSIIADGVRYLSLVRYSYLPYCLCQTMSNALQALGKTKIPLFASGTSVLVKVLCNYALMYGHFGFSASGITGAAAATLIARCFELLVYLVIVHLNDFAFKTKIKDLFDIPFQTARNILFTAIPFSANNFLWSAGNSMFLKIYASRGIDNYNAYAISATISDIFHTFNAGFGNATSVYLAQKLGKEDLQTVELTARKTYYPAFKIGMILCALMFACSYALPFIYSNISQNIVKTACDLVKLQSLTFILYEMGMQGYFIFKAGGDTRSIAIMDSLSTWLIQIPILAAFAYLSRIDIRLLFLTSQIGEAVKLFISLYLFSRKRWLNNLTTNNT